MIRTAIMALLIIATGPHRSVRAQMTPAVANAPVFEVASVKPDNAAGRSSFTSSGGRLLITKFSLIQLIQQAFGIREFQISGGPDWLTTDATTSPRQRVFSAH